MKKLLAVTLCAILALTMLVSCAKQEENGKTPDAQRSAMRVTALKGPTGMGMAKLMRDDKANTTALDYTFTVASSPDEVTADIIAGNFDVAALPTNLAAVLYAKTGGALKIAAVNTTGVLYIMENGNTISSIDDLAGKKIYATGQGSTPEYVLNYVLNAFGIECEVEYLAEHSELAAKLISGDCAVGLLPVPNVTAVTSSSECRIALNMTELWEKAAEKRGETSALYQGCIVVNKAYAEAHAAELDAFLNEYKASVEYVTQYPEIAAEMIAENEIIPSAAVAKAAIPNAGLCFITGDEMKTNLTGFFNVLFSMNPKAVGGSVPDAGIYYAKG